MPRRSRSRSRSPQRRRHSDGAREHRDSRERKEKRRPSKSEEDGSERRDTASQQVKKRRFEEKPKKISPIRMEVSHDQQSADGSRRRRRRDGERATAEKEQERGGRRDGERATAEKEQERGGRRDGERATAEKEQERGGRRDGERATAEKEQERGVRKEKVEEEEEEGGNEKRSDRFRNEREARFPGRQRDQGMQDAERAQTEGQRWRDNRRGRGRGRGRGDWHDRGGNWQAIGEEGEENEELNSRLYSSLTNPQDVPRKGYFFEHDDREAPPSDLHRTAPRRRFSESKGQDSDHAPPRRERDREREREREPHYRRHSSNDDRHDRQRGREVRGQGEWQERRRGSPNEDRQGRWERRGRRPRSPARWRHDRFHEESDDTAEEVRGPERRLRSPVRWKHDKFEEEIEAEAPSDPTVLVEVKEEDPGEMEGVDEGWAQKKFEELVNIDNIETES